MLNNIQALRAIAALMVVHSHAAGTLGLRYDGGAHGVDLFFVISGFIIAHVASTDPSQFLTRRLIRIVPTYWVATLALFAVIQLVPSMFRGTAPDVGLLIRSLLFVPDASSVHSDGLPHPTLNAGWTLNYEMYFYVVFAIALAISKRQTTVIAIGLLFGVMAIIHVTTLRHHVVAAFYGNTIVNEFILGMLAFHVVGHAEQHPPPKEIAGMQKVVYAAGVVFGIMLLLFAKEIFGTTDRWIGSGIPAFIVVGSAVMLERIHGWRIHNKLIILIGDASYVLYLTHVYVVVAIIRLVLRDQTFSEPIGQVVSIGLIAVSALVSVVMYRYGEKPLLGYFKRRFVHARTPQIQPAIATRS